ncbi:uncharacterized protein LOC127279948 [Leptopilina boulardi]|uniref:uncharacterized protein LOC127279948 n=1 Tax=Leptopilina boulardi TaxID=63433 RepID=UPI0021F624FA|nr:uncharacterized protein LOC127279948 [Leptopilina boulardi]
MKKIENMQQHIDSLIKKYSQINEDSMMQKIKDLPEQQQKVVKTILKYGKLDNKHGMRYSREWILECILLRIKSRKAYIHLKNHQILPLPALTTLRRYMKNMKPQYGFDPQVFSMLKKKSASIKSEEKRGVLVIDEMKISKSVSFDSDNLSILGFTDLREHTLEHQKMEQADHALVFLYQPFQGKWIQNVAAFLSKGAANGQVLSHLVTECIILLEDDGFQADVVTTDGAQWNRTMWKNFGLKELDTSCIHVSSVDEAADQEPNQTRRFWFCYDFSHLIKNFMHL